MYNIDYKNVKKGNKIYILFLSIGILFFVIFIIALLVINHKNSLMDKEVMSTKVEIVTKKDSDGDIGYSPVYYYEVDGTELTCNSTISSSNKPSTENKKVFYNSDDPANCITEYSKSTGKIFIIFLIIPVVFISVGIIFLRSNHKRIKQIKQLSETGKLIKNLPYRLEDSNISVNGIPLKRPVIDYTLPNGVTIPLYGEPRMDGKLYDEDGLVDLLIDEQNPEIYFIDFEINPISNMESNNDKNLY